MFNFVSLPARYKDNNERKGGCMKKKLIAILLIVIGLLSSMEVEVNAQKWKSLGKATKDPKTMFQAGRREVLSYVPSTFYYPQNWMGGVEQTLAREFSGLTARSITPAKKFMPTAVTISDMRLDRRILNSSDIKKRYEQSTREHVMPLVVHLLSPFTGGDKATVRKWLANELLRLNRMNKTDAWNEFMLLAKQLMVSDTDEAYAKEQAMLLSHELLEAKIHDNNDTLLGQDKSTIGPDIRNLHPLGSSNEPTFAPRKEENNQQSLDATFTTTLQDKDSEVKSKTIRLLSPKDDKRWVEIGKEIEELGIRLGLEKMENLLFPQGMQIDVDIEEDSVGFIIYSYEYKLDAA